MVSGAWTQVGGDIDGEFGGDQSGTSVSINSDGTRVAIGEIGFDPTPALGLAGRVRVFDLVAGAWVQVGAGIEGEAAFDRLGTSVEISSGGDRVAIGITRSDATDTDAGQVKIYDLMEQIGFK